MALLTTEMCDKLTDDHIEILNKANIWNVNDLCSNDLMKIKSETGLKYNLLKSLVDKVKERYTLPQYDLFYVVECAIKDLKICPTGIPELTCALEGGYQTQEIVELSGDSGTGKTEMCYLLCGAFLTHLQDKVLFITSQSDFDIEKVIKYIKSKAMRDLSDEDIFNYLQRVSVARPTRLADLVHLLNTDDILELHIDDSAKDAVDVYLSEVMRILTNIAINKNVILFITTSNYSQLAGYKSWTNGIDHRIHLRDNPHRATVVKTIHKPSLINYLIPFEINDEGLFAVRVREQQRPC